MNLLHRIGKDFEVERKTFWQVSFAILGGLALAGLIIFAAYQVSYSVQSLKLPNVSIEIGDGAGR